ncbi:hypothetical protein [Eubacterium sp. An3]|nr:hypothetical protein [Eubacterium sp. An3]
MQYIYDMENVQESKEKGKVRMVAYKEAMEAKKAEKKQKEGEQ